MKCNATIASTKRMKVYTGVTVNLLSRQTLPTIGGESDFSLESHCNTCGE